MPPRRSRAWSTDDAPRQTLYNAYNVSPLRQQGGSIEYMTGGGALNMAAWTGE